MTTATETRPATSPLDGVRLSFGGIVRSEWIKLRSLRSTFWCLALVVVLSVGFSTLVAGVYHLENASAIPAEGARQMQVLAATVGVSFTQLVAAVLGVLVITGEYSTGMIRSTFAAAPGRLGAYFGKLLVLAVVVFVVSAVSLALSALVSTAIFSGRGLTTDLFAGQTLYPLLGAACYLTLIAAMAYTAGVIIRNAGGGIATVLGLLLVLPVVINLAGALTHAQWVSNLGQFLPSSAGGQLYAFQPEHAATAASGVISLDAWQGLGVLALWVVIPVIVGAVLIKRRDV
ncbi:ABC transporter permease subunit [Humibacter albus]|jgi:ABC-2 type transport system permease protein|uniref:ABC transporter permease subunit n=1 Tax=Humibacter albus TaxID=427754 RepID=UPI0003B5327F|nr:ABC transporter permease subunit [Humibacter albus]